jgi:primosomal protein N' (replication factor Y) (superfamily II helicase)
MDKKSQFSLPDAHVSAVVKFPMEFVDVVFPLNLGPLVYRCNPDHGPLSPGMLVRAEVRGRSRFGMVFGKTGSVPDGDVKEIAWVSPKGSLVSEAMVRLFIWMAGYYLLPEGVVLKCMMHQELTDRPEKGGGGRTRKAVNASSTQYPLDLPQVPQEILQTARRCIRKGGYHTYLYHAPTTVHEIAFVLDVAKGARNLIVLVPEISHIELFSPLLEDVFRDRLTILHGRISKKERTKAVERLLSGDSDVVLGTRIAVTAPLRSPACIAVLQEQSRSYKNLEGVRYHARDVAVMRGFLERSPVILSSTAPSLESFSTTLKGKYTLLRSDRGVRRPAIDVIDARRSRMTTPYLSHAAIQAASRCIKDKENVLFLINRKGFAMIECSDCGEVQSCPSCRIPLVYHRDKMIMRCNSCRAETPVRETCIKCRSTRLELVGAGTQRIASDLKRRLGIEPLRFDGDAMKDKDARRRLPVLLEDQGVVVGTKAVAPRLKRWTCKLCVLLNPDTGLHRPDFRASELLFQEIVAISEYVAPGGRIILQTKMPESDVYKYVRKYRFTDFYRSELSRRRSLLYPPYSRMLLFTLSSKKDHSAAIMDAIEPAGGKVEVIGPLLTTEKGVHLCRVIVKSRHRDSLNSYFRKTLEDLKKEKGLRISVDMDPVAF